MVPPISRIVKVHGGSRLDELQLEADLRELVNCNVSDLDALESYINRDRKEMALHYIKVRREQLKRVLEAE
jgi:hypothetical protein